MSVAIYSSSTAGATVAKNTELLRALCRGVLRKDVRVVFLDLESKADLRAQVWAASGKQHVYPLLFKGEEFVGTMEEAQQLHDDGLLAERIQSEEPELEDLVDFFLCTAEAFDAVAPVLEAAKERAIAVAVCEQLKLPKGMPVYAGRGDALRLHGTFALTSTAWEQFVVFSKDAVPEMKRAVDFVEQVFACDATLRGLTRRELERRGLAPVPTPTDCPQLQQCRRLLTKFTTTLEEDDDERIPAAMVRRAVEPLQPWTLEQYLESLPPGEAPEPSQPVGPKRDSDELHEKAALTETLIEELDMLLPDPSGFEFPPPPPEVEEEEETDKKNDKEKEEETYEGTSQDSEDNDNVVATVQPAAVDAAPNAKPEPLTVSENDQQQPKKEEVAAASSSPPHGSSPNVSKPNVVRAFLADLNRRVAAADAVLAVPPRKVLEISVKKPFSVAAVMSDKKEKKEKKDRKVDKEKKRLAKLLEQDGVTGNESEQKALAAAAKERASPGSKDTLRAVDSVPLMFLRVTMGKCKRNSNFVLSADPGAMEDVLRLPYDEEAAQPGTAILDGRLKGLAKLPTRMFADETLNDTAQLHKAFVGAFAGRAPTFVGRECVDWFVHKFRVSREDGVWLGMKLLRNKTFFAVGDNFELEDDILVRFKLVNSPADQIEVYLMGSSGAFGPNVNAPLAMLMFSSAADLCKEKVIVLRNGRHTFELRCAIVEAAADEGRVELPSAAEHIAASFRGVLRDRQDVMTQIGAVLETLEGTPPDTSALSREQAVRCLAEAGCGLDRLCRLLCDSAVNVPSDFVSSSGFNLLHMACLADSVEAATRVLTACSWQSSRTGGPSALHCAVLGGSPACISLLCNAIKDPALLAAVAWSSGFSALHLAVAVGAAECAATLIRSGCALEQRDAFGASPLLTAAYAGSVACVKLLLQNGAKCDARDDNDNSALAFAAARGFPHVAHLLLTARPELAAAKNRAGDGPLWLAMARGSVDVTELVGRALPKEALNEACEGRHRNTLLHRATLFLPDHVLRELIVVLSSVNELAQLSNAQKLRPLHLAIALGKVASASALWALQPAREIADETDSAGNTLLHLALSGRAVDWVMSHAAPAKLDVRNSLFFTSLMTCCAAGSHEAIAAQLGNDCDPTEVHAASRRGAMEYLEARESARLVIPFADKDDEVPGLFRIRTPASAGSSGGSTPSTPGTVRKKQLTQGLSRRSSKQLKEGGGGEIVVALSKKNRLAMAWWSALNPSNMSDEAYDNVKTAGKIVAFVAVVVAASWYLNKEKE